MARIVIPSENKPIVMFTQGRKVWKLCGLLTGFTFKKAVGRLQGWEKTVFNLVKSSTFSIVTFYFCNKNE